MMSNGTSGDVNIWDFQGKKDYPKKHFEKSKLIGTDLARKVSSSIKNNDRWELAPTLSAKTDPITLSRRKPTAGELDKARKIVSQSNYEAMSAINHTNSDKDLQKIYAREQVLLGELPDTRTCPLQVIKIGRLLIGGLPGEFFAETGRWLKKHSPAKHYFSIGLANDYVGYVPPPDQHKLGGYETWLSRGKCLETTAEPKIRTKIKSMLEEIDNA
jgi:hypothetical protein